MPRPRRDVEAGCAWRVAGIDSGSCTCPVMLAQTRVVPSAPARYATDTAPISRPAACSSHGRSRQHPCAQRGWLPSHQQAERQRDATQAGHVSNLGARVGDEAGNQGCNRELQHPTVAAGEGQQASCFGVRPTGAGAQAPRHLQGKRRERGQACVAQAHARQAQQQEAARALHRQRPQAAVCQHARCNESRGTDDARTDGDTERRGHGGVPARAHRGAQDLRVMRSRQEHGETVQHRDDEELLHVNLPLTYRKCRVWAGVNARY